MADGNYYESYPGIEGGAAMMPPMAAYRHSSDPSNGFGKFWYYFDLNRPYL